MQVRTHTAASLLPVIDALALDSVDTVIQSDPVDNDFQVGRGSSKQDLQSGKVKPNEEGLGGDLPWPTGFRRSMHLGAWLGILAFKEPELASLAVRLFDSLVPLFRKRKFCSI